MSLFELTQQYDTAEKNEDWDACNDLMSEIVSMSKNYSDIQQLYEWRIQDFIKNENMPLFSLEYHDGHPEHDYNKSHYHIEIFMNYFLGQYDVAFLVNSILGLGLDGYASPSGGHFHFFENEETMTDAVNKLNEVLVK